MNIVTVIQARTGSTRLPNKVLMPLTGKTLLERMIERIQWSELAGKIIVATTEEKSDDVIQEICEKNNFQIYRGSTEDLLDRHYQAAKLLNADAVVKIPSDCPLIDYKIIDKVITYFINNSEKYDFVSNLHPATYPDGNDVEIMHFSVLEDAWKNAKRKLEREHTTPYIWENPDKFRIGNVEWETGLNYSMSHRFTIDYPEDYEFIKRVFDELYHKNPKFSLEEILNLLEEKPEIKKINEKYCGVNWYRNHLNELKTITADQTKII
ncbi:Polysaccharide biosynthesis protein [Ignavibacterium album JCM 16511]|uniref:Polysaccharide biosynthesis protein n=1 Tax=Ignavibacterium album (strain DSM 19864 / JCM 16511 / NBRC 101810 / Mat9-16) TaxID=945713 RepID=I0AJS3_IGNAJ|nr:glycosyltransferase family protein [Ignavibacterium album]AFH49230.1 Polysaccharide biosynthesis protein [Ignavibacterium album JCM 16511]